MPHAAFPPRPPLALALATIIAAPADALAAEARRRSRRRPTDLDKVEVVRQVRGASRRRRSTPSRCSTRRRRSPWSTSEVMDAAEPARPARRAQHAAGHHLRRGRRRRRLRRQHQPARLQRQQRHHHRRRARQRAVHPHRPVQPRAIELVNGANSVYSGAGSVGGNINLVSKAARRRRFARVHAGAGTDGYGRVTLDSNIDLGNGAALRLNAMAHQNDAPGRDVEDFERWGIAPSIAFGLGTDTALHAELPPPGRRQHPAVRRALLQRLRRSAAGRRAASNYYGYRNVDTQEIDVDMLTGVFEHDFSDTTVAAQPRALPEGRPVQRRRCRRRAPGAWRTASTPHRRAACTVGQAHRHVPARQSRAARAATCATRSNSIAISQTDLTTRFNTGAIEHALVAGVSFSHETFDLDTGNAVRAMPTARCAAAACRCTIADPEPLLRPARSTTSRAGRHRRRSSTTRRSTCSTRLKFSEQWLLNLGARYEHNEGDYDRRYRQRSPPARPSARRPAVATFENDDDLFSYRAGLVFKPVEAGSIYLSYANTKTPSKASVNGALHRRRPATSIRKPRSTSNSARSGTSLEDRLAVTARAVPQRPQELQGRRSRATRPTRAASSSSTARRACDGVALGVAGQHHARLGVFANYT